MFDAGRRPMGRLFYWMLAGLMTAIGFGLSAEAAAPQNNPATTTVSDTVYMADGSAAAGSLIITWPAFVTASGSAVAGGALNVTLGANGALNVALVPNAGASFLSLLRPRQVGTQRCNTPLPVVGLLPRQLRIPNTKVKGPTLTSQNARR